MKKNTLFITVFLTVLFVTIKVTGQECGTITPAGLKAKSVSATSEILTWDAVSGATGYNLQYKVAPNGAWMPATPILVTTNSKQLSGLLCGSTYLFQVQAVCSSGGLSSYSPPASFVVGVPDNNTFTTTSLTATSVTLSWSAVTGSSGYTVQYGLPSGAWTTKTTSANTIDITGLTSSTYYQFRVKNNCTTANNYSANGSFTTLDPSSTPCGIPTGLTISNITTTSADLLWNTVPGVTAYVVQINQDGGLTSYEYPNSNYIYNYNLTPLKNYNFRVKAVCSSTLLSSLSQPFSFTTGTPTGLTVSNIQSTSAYLNWTAVAGATGYKVQYKNLSETSWTTVNASPSSPGIMINNLTPYTQYEFRVQAYNSSVTSNYSSNYGFTTAQAGACNTPSVLTANCNSTTSVTISWNSANGINYNVQYRKYGTAWNPLPSITNNYYILNSLIPNTQYEFQVQTVCSDGSSSFSYPKSFTTPTICDVPIGLAVSNISGTTATISWTSVSGVNNYEISYKANNAATWITTYSSGNSKLLENLSPSTVYKYKLKTNCSSCSGSSNDTPEKSFTTSLPCAVPSGLTIDNITQNSFWIIWNNVSAATGGYDIQLRKVGDYSWIDYGASSNEFGTSIDSSSSYEIQIQSACVNNTTSGWSSPYIFSNSSSVPTILCGTPVGLNATDISNTSAKLKWNAVADALSYNIKYRVKPLNYSSNNIWDSTSSYSNSVVVNNLLPSKTYEFLVQAVCPSGAGNYSAAPFTFTTTSCATPANVMVKRFYVNNSGNLKYVIKWNNMPDVNYYDIEYTKLPLTAYSVQTTFTPDDSVEFSVYAGKPYLFKVKTNCASGTLSNWSELYFTSESEPDAPTGLSVSNITNTSAKLEWNAVQNAVSYKVKYWINGLLSSTETILPTASTSLIISNLTTYTIYNFEVQAINGFGMDGGWSDDVQFTTAGSCGVPTGLTAVITYVDEADIQWNAVSGAVRYIYRYKLTSVSTWETDSTTYTDEEIDIDVPGLYEVQVKTFCAAGYSAWSQSFNFSNLNCVPTGLTALNITATSVKLSWNSVSNATYEVHYRKLNASSWIAVTPITTSTYITISPLTNNTTYEFEVRIVGMNVWSDAINVTTANSSCGTPDGLKVINETYTNTGSWSVILGWDAVPGASSYNVQYKEMYSGWTPSINTLTNTIEISGLNTGTTYKFKVQAVCSATGNFSTEYTFEITGGNSGCTDNYEPNNTYSGAKTISVNTPINALIGTQSDADFYSFSNTSSQRNIKVLLSNLPYDYDMVLYDPSGNVIPNTAQGGTTNEEIKYNNGPVGTYHIQVYGYNGAYSSTSCYILTAYISNSNFKITGETEDEEIKNMFILFPNPAKEQATISYNSVKDGVVNVKVIDLTGRMVSFNEFNVTEGANTYTLDLNDVNNGLYFVELSNGKDKILNKLIVDK